MDSRAAALPFTRTGGWCWAGWGGESEFLFRRAPPYH